MAIRQPKLPYDMDALEPHISAETMQYHFGKHHTGYVNKLNKQIEGTPLDKLTLEQIIDQARRTAAIDVLNNALQAWNHAFLWESMSAGGSGKPNDEIARRIERDFGDIESFKKKFLSVATGLFGSGWVWLVEDNGKLQIVPTGNADSPVGTHMTPLLVVDVWEHAYYIDYRNDRKKYIQQFLDELINWDFAASNLEGKGETKAA